MPTEPKVIKTRRAKSKITRNDVEKVMKLKGICAQELADLINTNPAHINRILKSERPCISLPIALKIAKALGVPVEKLFE